MSKITEKGQEELMLDAMKDDEQVRLTALKSKEVDETGVAQTKRQSPDQDQHGPRGRALLPGQAEQAFPGRSGPAQTEGQSPPSQADQDQRRPSGRALSQNGMSHPLGPFRGNAGGMGAFGGPFSPRGEPLQAEQAFSQSAVTNPVGQGRPGPAKPGPAQTEGQSALSGHAKCMTNPVHRPRGRALGIPCWDP